MALQVGGVSDETVNMVVSSAGLGPESDCSGKASKLQIQTLARGGDQHQETHNFQKRKGKSGHMFQMGARHQDMLTNRPLVATSTSSARVS
jgi:hypothetical protein